MTIVQGPSWTRPGLDVAAGRYPLSVERHVMRTVELLVPGVTTVTPHARYYALHALVAVEATRRGLTTAETQQLLRRAEVTLAAVYYAHDHAHDHAGAGFPRAHGMGTLAKWLSSGEVDLDEVSQPGRDGYARSAWGFWNPYAASEIALEILQPEKFLTPGNSCDENAVRDGLDGLLDLARRRRLVVDELSAHGELCVCAGGNAPDGRWLARLLCSPVVDEDGRSRDTARHETIRLLTRTMQTHPVRNATGDVGSAVAFGDFITTDPVAASLSVAQAWRGVMLRNYAVGAWRRLWSWLVGQVNGTISVDELADRFADELPDTTVAAFLDELPATVTATGAPAPAEQQLRDSDGPPPRRELAVLAVGARRIDELTGRARDAFLGRQYDVELGPRWTARRLDEAHSLSLRDFAQHLTRELVTRSQRIALSKARPRLDGSLWLPTRLHQRGELLFKTSDEGGGEVGLRFDRLTTVLAGAGVVRRVDGMWQVTPDGEALLG